MTTIKTAEVKSRILGWFFHLRMIVYIFSLVIYHYCHSLARRQALLIALRSEFVPKPLQFEASKIMAELPSNKTRPAPLPPVLSTHLDLTKPMMVEVDRRAAFYQLVDRFAAKGLLTLSTVIDPGEFSRPLSDVPSMTQMRLEYLGPRSITLGAARSRFQPNKSRRLATAEETVEYVIFNLFNLANKMRIVVLDRNAKRTATFFHKDQQLILGASDFTTIEDCWVVLVDSLA